MKALILCKLDLNEKQNFLLCSKWGFPTVPLVPVTGIKVEQPQNTLKTLPPHTNDMTIIQVYLQIATVVVPT